MGVVKVMSIYLLVSYLFVIYLDHVDNADSVVVDAYVINCSKELFTLIEKVRRITEHAVGTACNAGIAAALDHSLISNSDVVKNLSLVLVILLVGGVFSEMHKIMVFQLAQVAKPLFGISPYIIYVAVRISVREDGPLVRNLEKRN